MKNGNKLKILVVSNLCPPEYEGGFELSALRNAESLRALGHEVDLITSKFRKSFQGERTDRHFVSRIFRLSTAKDGWALASSFMDGSSKLDFSFGELAKQVAIRMANIGSILGMLQVSSRNEAAMRGFLSDKEYDVAYVFGLHMIGTSVIHPLMAKGIPLVYHQGDEWLAAYIFGSPVKHAILTAFAPLRYRRERKIDLSRVVTVSHFMKTRFGELGFPLDGVSVIHRGFEHATSLVETTDRYAPPVFLLASRLALYKGIHIAIRAAETLDAQMPDQPWEMWIAGGGDPKVVAFFERMIAELKVEHRVKLLGKLSRDQVIQHMRRSTAFISPSVFDEPFGNTNIEAMASGAPLIASRSGAIEEIVVNSESGLIYNRASHNELASHMKLILTEPSVAERLSRRGVERVQNHFLQSEIIRQVEDTLRVAAGVSPDRVESTSATLR